MRLEQTHICPAFCGCARKRFQRNAVRIRSTVQHSAVARAKECSKMRFHEKKKKNFLPNAYNNHVTFARKTIEAIESYRLSKTNCSVRPYEYPVRGVCFDEYTRRRLYLDE